jgi:hypothetical protein
MHTRRHTHTQSTVPAPHTHTHTHTHTSGWVWTSRGPAPIHQHAHAWGDQSDIHRAREQSAKRRVHAPSATTFVASTPSMPIRCRGKGQNKDLKGARGRGARQSRLCGVTDSATTGSMASPPWPGGVGRGCGAGRCMTGPTSCPVPHCCQDQKGSRRAWPRGCPVHHSPTAACSNITTTTTAHM